MPYTKLILTGLAAGTVNGLMGAGGGMLLLPLLGKISQIPEKSRFPTGLAIMLPISITTLLFTPEIDWTGFLPWLPGSAIGGLAAGLFGKRIPTAWLHRLLGLLMIFGGVRYLWV